MAKKAREIEETEEQEDIASIIEFSEDISTAEDPDPLPEGDYPSEIVTAVVQTSKTKGTRYAQVMFRINEEDYPADFDAENAPGHKQVRFMIGLEDNLAARARLRKFLEAIGAPMSKRIDVNTWIGLPATVSLRHDTYEGVTREQVSRVQEA